ncbi:MAG: DEAD/DEAH box helicase [Campylobacterales bacterium]|nr:DEAD/DEAH box helicase [Campylobacterales bacterium]
MIQSRFYDYLKSTKKPPQVVVCEDAAQASRLRDVALFLDLEPLVLPDMRATYLDDLRSYGEELSALFEAIRTFDLKRHLVIAPFKTLLFPFPQKSLLLGRSLSFGDRLDLGAFKRQMLHWGYSIVDIVEVEGEVSFRGDIIDLYPPGSSHPWRISLFDDEIEQIKGFASETQRTMGDEVDSIALNPALFALDEAQYDALHVRVSQCQSDSFVRDIASLGFWLLGDLAENFLEGKSAVAIAPLDALIDEAYSLNTPQIERRFFEAIAPIPLSERTKELSVTDVPTLLKVHEKKRITIIASSEAQLKAAGLYDTKALHVKQSGLILSLINDNEVIISLNKPVKKRRRRKSSLILDDLKPGDYVVHEEYGVGIFEAIEQARILGGIKDFIKIRYQGDDRVLLPVENLEVIDRYIAGGDVPTLDRLGKGGFTKLKESVKKRLFEIAGEIVGTAASRALIKAPVIAHNPQDMAAFAKLAGFEYTPDQSEAIEQILEDLSSGIIMDRLLSGDVGFGKTEVAMNAIFATVRSGFQAALIVPTTLLSAQHFHSIEKRFLNSGYGIARLDRFLSTAQKNAVLKGLSSGEIRIVVGTHALFGAHFANLGLVIIDEEHKFGVKQKEKLKQLYEKVHLLSMSATPIPRSLNQALSSIKMLSTLLTPPSERQGVRTFVKAYDEKLIKEVILRELRQGGQLFYVHNSIDHMVIKEGELKALLPSLRILMLHSKIPAAQAEEELMRFEEGKYDLLLATSIIESGIHMPRVNTMIIDGADRFGIADLHQLRGRVGRGSVEGFAYFIVEDREHLTDEAKKRLIALESNSFLGSGSVLAYHDLEIRGGGNLVGDAQSGHIKNIGYSLYLRMLEDAIRVLSNKQETPRAKVDIKLAISAYLSDEIINTDRLRLELYRRLSQCESPLEVYEIEEEITDRFGKLDTPTKQFFEQMVIKLLALEKKIKTISSYAQNITLEFVSGAKETIKAASKDDDDIIKTTLEYLRSAKSKII